MRHNIRSRLEAIEGNQKKNVAPDLVMIFKNDSLCWIAEETYTRKNSKGAVIPKSAKIKRIKLERPEDYEPPEGFKGVVIVDDIQE